MGKYRQFDQWLINRINDAYLWLYDWTGIFVATVIFLDMNIVVLACIQRQSMWIGAIVFLCGVLVSLPRYYLQSKGPEAYNKAVLATESMYYHARPFFLFLNGSLLLGDLITGGSYPELAAHVASAMFWFLLEIKIRDRDKKTFKQPKQPKLATQSSQ